jgi:hypothetical protein
MENLFKFLFGLGIFTFAMVSAGIFLLIIKIILLFQPEVQFMGIIFSF